MGEGPADPVPVAGFFGHGPRTPGALVWVMLLCPAGIGQGQLSSEGKKTAAEGAFRGMQVCASDRPGLAGQIEGEQIGLAGSAGNSVAIVFAGDWRAP